MPWSLMGRSEYKRVQKYRQIDQYKYVDCIIYFKAIRDTTVSAIWNLHKVSNAYMITSSLIYNKS